MLVNARREQDGRRHRFNEKRISVRFIGFVEALFILFRIKWPVYSHILVGDVQQAQEFNFKCGDHNRKIMWPNCWSLGSGLCKKNKK